MESKIKSTYVEIEKGLNKALFAIFGDMKANFFITLSLALVLASCASDSEEDRLDGEEPTCDTENISYADFVAPTIISNCSGCHTGSSPSGGFTLETHEEVKTYADNGKLYGAVSHDGSASAMPPGSKMPDCTVDKIKSWIDAGALDN